jgi:hypothetical protein
MCGSAPADQTCFLCWKIKMRYCPHCHRLNPGHPVICHYCARTWYVRLCPRHHQNPVNAQFCGECGSADLTETAGPRPWWPYFIKILILLFLCAVFFLISKACFLSLKGELLFLIMRFVFPIIFLFVGYMIALSILPQPVKKLFTKINKFFLKGLSKVILWFGRTMSEFINLILNL